MMKAAHYARVSTRDQQTLSMQLKTMREYAASRGWSLEMEVEETSSGIKKREKRNQIILAAKKREIDVIVVWKLDRWGRSLAGLINELQDLNVLGVGFVSITEALDFTTPSRKAMAGIAHARAKGKPHGRPKTAALKAEKIKQMAKDGFNKSQIARNLGISRTSVRRILNDSQS